MTGGILYLMLQLAWTFLVIGTFTIGGGYAMLSLIQNEVVVSHGWISESTFTDIVAVSQMTPGPVGINTATYVGYDVLLNATGSSWMGVLGSLTATLALMLPSFVIMLLIVRFYLKFNIGLNGDLHGAVHTGNRVFRFLNKKCIFLRLFDANHLVRDTAVL